MYKISSKRSTIPFSLLEHRRIKLCFWMDAKVILSALQKSKKCWRSLAKNVSQWAKNQKVFQGGAGPKFPQFPLEISVLMLKYQKLAKSVGRNWAFWNISDLENFGIIFDIFYEVLHRWRFFEIMQLIALLLIKVFNPFLTIRDYYFKDFTVDLPIKTEVIPNISILTMYCIKLDLTK